MNPAANAKKHGLNRRLTMANNPCFNCPDKEAGCSTTCPRWAKFRKSRDEEYKKRTERRFESSIGSNSRKQSRIDAYKKRNDKRYKNNDKWN